jgi:MYXO-CTERM domain-containing protein
MNKVSLLTAGAALSLTGAAFADFTGFSGVESTYGGMNVIDVYADFDAAGSAVLNIFNASVFLTDGSDFNHNDLADAQGGSWKPSFSFSVPGVYDPDADSYVTIGYGVGALAALNQTALDPGFGDGLGGTMPMGTAGWFNLTPDNAQYATDNGEGGYSLHVGQFVFAADTTFTFDAEIGFNNGPGTTVGFGEGIFTTVPAPGALALLGLSGVVARRRRA